MKQEGFAQRIEELEKEIERLKERLEALNIERENLKRQLKNAINQYEYYEHLLKDMRKTLRPFTMKELLLRI